MDLFSHLIDKEENYLPKDGIVNFYGSIIPYEKALYYYETFFSSIAWKNDVYNVVGKNIVTNRQIAWFGNEEININHFNTKKLAKPWTEELLELKKLIEKETNETYNSCLLNLYHTGKDGLGWHRDSEKGAVASLSLGATRKFVFKHKETKEKVAFNLTQGDLLVMKGLTQEFWLHSVPATKKIQTPRINLTFRTI